MATAQYDVFLSHTWADGERPELIYEALKKAGLRVWFDKAKIDDFASITRAVTEGLSQSKVITAYYSKTYPLRRACQWELTAAFLAAETDGNPLRRMLVINPEGDADHIYPVELLDAKHLKTPNTVGEMQELVHAICKHVAAVDGPFANIHPLTPPIWYGRAPVGSTRFVGRLKAMWEVHSLLHAGDKVMVTGAAAASGSICQVQGLGGVGKSLLAEEYALHFGADYPGGIFWVHAYGNDDAKLGPEQGEVRRADQVRQFAERLGIDAHGLTAEEIRGELDRKMRSEGKSCLWVVDDVPSGLDGDALRAWFAPSAMARTLITTRSGEYGSMTKVIDLSVLTRDEANQLLSSRREPEGDAEKEQARGLADDLGYHALALDVTASALASYGDAEPYRKFREELSKKDEDALELSTELADALPNGHEKSITQTMLRSIRSLGTEGQDFLRLASVLAVAPIPASLVTAVFGTADGLETSKAERRQRVAFHDVDKASLAEEKHLARSVHILVSRAVLFDKMGAPERTQALRDAAVVALQSEITKAAREPTLYKQFVFLVAHARQVIAMPVNLPDLNLLRWVAKYDCAHGDVCVGPNTL